MEWLSDMTNTSIERESLLPSSRFFFPNEIEEEEDREKGISAARDNDAVVLTDGDADGFGAVLTLREKHPGIKFIPCGPHSRRLDLEDGIEIVTEYLNPDGVVYIADISPDGMDAVNGLSDLADHTSEIRWFDHHEWDEDVYAHVDEYVDELVVNTGDHKDSDSDEVEQCGAEIALESVESDGVEVSDTVREAVRVTGIYDCWRKVTDENGEDLKEFVDERARDLHDYAVIAEPEAYLTSVYEHGADIMDDPNVASAVESYRDKQERLGELAVERADLVEVGDVTVGVTYGRCPTNDVADELKEQGADAIVLIKPSGGISLRGTTEFERCNEVAEAFDGGGHGRAAGCFIAPKNDGDHDRWDTDMLDYADHWISQGEKSRRMVMEEIESLVEN